MQAKVAFEHPAGGTQNTNLLICWLDIAIDVTDELVEKTPWATKSAKPRMSRFELVFQLPTNGFLVWGFQSTPLAQVEFHAVQARWEVAKTEDS